MGYAIKHTKTDSFPNENGNGLYMLDISEGFFVFTDKSIAETALEHLIDANSNNGIIQTEDGDFPVDEFEIVEIEVIIK